MDADRILADFMCLVDGYRRLEKRCSELEANKVNADRFYNWAVDVDSVAAMHGVSKYAVREYIRMGLIEPHLKVGEEKHDIIWFLDREFEVIKALLVTVKPEWKKYQHTTRCEHVITPFIQNDTSADITNYSKAAGVLVSQKTAIKRAGLAADADAEYEEIQKEKMDDAETRRMEDVFTGAE